MSHLDTDKNHDADRRRSVPRTSRSIHRPFFYQEIIALCKLLHNLLLVGDVWAGERRSADTDAAVS